MSATGKRVQYSQDYFVYGTQFGNIVSGATLNNIINIQDDADFYVCAINASGYVDGGSTASAPNVNCTVQITDNRKGRALLFSPAPLGNLCGFVGVPFILPQPYKFTRLSTIQVTLNNFDAAAQYDGIYFAFLGIKVYSRPQGPGNIMRRAG